MQFSVIYIDPPWQYKVWSKKGLGRSAESHYPTQSKDWIAELPIMSLARKDCVLLCWATMPCLSQALSTIAQWGFTYKTAGFVWTKTYPVATEKDFVGMGYWTRANAEICILASIGNPSRVSKSVRQLIREPYTDEWVFEQEINAPVAKHSSKPVEVYNRIEALLDGPYLEVFARNTREGWISIGNEITGNDILIDMENLK